MKKVWVLERWIDKDGMKKSLEDIESVVEYAKQTESDEYVVKGFEDTLTRYLQKMKDNPEGYWSGYVGRSKYRQFCSDAKEDLRHYVREKREDPGNFRVVEGLIEDGAKTWCKYKHVKVNDGVLRYLLATM